MANKYQKRPSEVLNIDNDYLAYCFDEAALYLEFQAMDDKSKINWNKIKWVDDEKKNNGDFVEFLKKHS